MDDLCQMQPTHLWTMAKTPPDLHESTEQHPLLLILSLFFHMDTMSPSLTRSWQPSCLSWAGATESIILLQLCRCGCLINDTTNNNCHAVTSVSSSQLAQPGAGLCRLPPQIRTPLEKLFTHLSSPQAPLHFVCPPKDPMEDILTFFQSEK